MGGNMSNESRYEAETYSGCLDPNFVVEVEGRLLCDNSSGIYLLLKLDSLLVLELSPCTLCSAKSELVTVQFEFNMRGH
jgi:hypothetical protein